MIELECPPPGSSPQTRAWFESIRRKVRALRPVESVGVLTLQTTLGVQRQAIRRAAAGSSSDAISAFQIAAVQNDYLQCNEITWDKAGAQTISSDIANIAKPESLRVSNLGAYTNVTSNARTVPIVGTPGIAEGLKPPYAPGSVILAVRLSDRTPVLVSGETLEWEDLDVDSRNWFPPYQIVNVCINGVSRRMIVAGSPPFA